MPRRPASGNVRYGTNRVVIPGVDGVSRGTLTAARDQRDLDARAAPGSGRDRRRCARARRGRAAERPSARRRRRGAAASSRVSRAARRRAARFVRRPRAHRSGLRRAPARPRRAARASVRIAASRRMSSASSSGVAESRPVCSSMMMSGVPPVFIAAIGTPSALASMQHAAQRLRPARRKNQHRRVRQPGGRRPLIDPADASGCRDRTAPRRPRSPRVPGRRRRSTSGQSSPARSMMRTRCGRALVRRELSQIQRVGPAMGGAAVAAALAQRRDVDGVRNHLDPRGGDLRRARAQVVGDGRAYGDDGVGARDARAACARRLARMYGIIGSAAATAPFACGRTHCVIIAAEHCGHSASPSLVWIRSDQ